MNIHSVNNTIRAPSKERRAIPTVSRAFDDGTLLELAYDAKNLRTSFLVWQNGGWRNADTHVDQGGERLVPYSPHNNLIRNDVVLLPSEPEEYDSEGDLVREIQTFIHRYVDVSPRFERIATYYVLFSWLYDGFNELPYLRLRGDYGTGKTRFLLTVGSLCYKPAFASGASTVSPLFHILDAFRGTLIIDEGDFRFSDERADIVKILNNGNTRGFPVLRTEVSRTGEFNPRAFQVFGPKIVATRGYYEDRALESRFITEEMGSRALRNDVPINLPSSYKDEALRLRNKLLLYRFRNAGLRQPRPELGDPTIEPRLNQIMIPLMSVVTDTALQSELRGLAREVNRSLIADRSLETEAQVLEVIRELSGQLDGDKLSIKGITDRFIELYAAEYERIITPKWMGTLIRRKLQLATHKSHGTFVIPWTEREKLDRLYMKYGLTPDENGARDLPVSEGSHDFPEGDIGDDGDVAASTQDGAP